MRCQSCEKFVSLEMQEPESPDSLEVEFNEDEEAPEFHITGSVRIVRTCADCGTEMKEATLDIDVNVDLFEGLSNAPQDKGPSELVEAEKVPFGALNEATVEDESISAIEEGGGRYQKAYYGADAVFVIRAGPDDAVVARATWSDKVAASAMDEI